MNFKHGQAKTKLYKVWIHMISRCENPNHSGYKYWGGRGIKICSEWRKDFMAFYKWTLKNGYKEGLSIDRVDNDGNYEPGNCRFVTAKEQQRNSRNNKLIQIGEETKPMCVWAEQAGINYRTLKARIRANWPEHRLLEPVKK